MDTPGVHGVGWGGHLMASKTKTKLLETAKKRHRYAQDIYSPQRQREREDLEYQDPERQWTPEERTEREGGDYGNQYTVSVPARPTLAISKIEQPISRVLNQERNALLGVNIHPTSPDADDDLAEIAQGLYRQIARDSRANIARSWAYARAVWSGWGCYRVGTRYADEVGGDPFDQVVTIDRILHQDAVWFDPSAQQPDFSDAQYAFIDSWIPRKRFVEMYGEKYADEGGDFGSTVFEDPDWIRGSETDEEAVLVSEYFYRVFDTETLVRTSTGDVLRKLSDTEYETLDGEPVDAFMLEIVSEREREVPRVKWAKITGSGVLEEADWAGQYIPIIVVLGRELVPFDGERRYQGMVRPARDAQRTYNYAASSLVERAALEPKAPFVGDPKQFETFEDFWQQANTRNFPFLPANLVVEGQVLPPPQRAVVDTSTMGPAMLLLQQSDSFIQSTTQTPDPNLGNYDATERSGKAIEALQSAGDLGNSDYLHQLASVSMTYEAKVVLDLMPHIYDREGRIVRVMDEEENTSVTMLNQEFIVDPRTNKPIAFEEGMPAPPPARPPRPGEPPPSPPEPKSYDLHKGVYGVSVSIGRSFNTRMEHAQSVLGRIAESMPAAMPVVAPLLFEYSDFPGSKKLAGDLAKLRDQQYPILAQKDEGEELSPMEKDARLAMQEQQLQQLQQQLQELQQAGELDMAKQQATAAKAQLDAETKVVLAQMKAQSDKMIAELKAAVDLAVASMQERGEDARTAMRHLSEVEKLEMSAERGSPQKDD